MTEWGGRFEKKKKMPRRDIQEGDFKKCHCVTYFLNDPYAFLFAQKCLFNEVIISQREVGLECRIFHNDYL